MGLTEKRNELITGINVVLRKNMNDGDRRKELYKLLKRHETNVIEYAVESVVDIIRGGEQ